MSIPAPLTITGGLVIVPDGAPEQKSVRLEGGLISAIGDFAPAPGDTVLDATGCIVAPGLVDLGVFAIDKPAFHFGGITRAALMPDQSPALDHPAQVRFAAQSGKPDFWVHPLAAATKGLTGGELAEIALMREAGARAIATGRHWVANSGVMLKILQYAAMLDMVVISHAEDGNLTGSAVATAGEVATRLGLPSAPAEAEALAIARDIALAELTCARLHFRTVTTASGLTLIRQAKARGLAITAGTTPAYFTLSEREIGNYRTFARLSPPLRKEEDRLAVCEAICDGTIDVIASGHDPRGAEDKRLPFVDAAPGMAGAETLLALTLGLITDLPRAFTLLAANPAKLLGVKAGTLAPGYEADVAIINPDQAWTVDSAKMKASAGNTPYDQRPVKGRVLYLLKGGQIIAKRQ